MSSINKRIEYMRDRLEHIHDGKITVIFRNGNRRLVKAPECIDLIISSADDIESFTASGGGNGKLPDLFNDLLTKEVCPKGA